MRRDLRDPARLHRAAPARPGQHAVPAGRQRDLRASQGHRGTDLAELASDETDYKALIAKAKDTAEKVALAAEARHPTPGLRRRSRARRVLCGARAELTGQCCSAMGRSSDTREALIAEVIGDFGKVLDRIEAVQPAMDNDSPDMADGRQDARAGVEHVPGASGRSARETDKEPTVEHVTQAIDRAHRALDGQQKQAMQESARSIVKDEVGPPLRRACRIARGARCATRRPWEDWLTHAATVGTSVACVYLFHCLASEHAHESVGRPSSWRATQRTGWPPRLRRARDQLPRAKLSDLRPACSRRSAARVSEAPCSRERVPDPRVP